jgi:hypothetical protein
MLVSGLCANLLSVRRHLLQSLTSTTNNSLNPALIVSIIIYTLMALPKISKSGGLWSGEIMRDNVFSGILGHFHIWLSFVIIWYACTTHEPRFRKGIMYATSIFVLSFYPVKGWILITVFAIIFAEAQKSNKGKISIASLIIGGVTGIFLFFAIYLSRQLTVGFTLNDLSVQSQWIFSHFISYLTAGLFGLNAVVDGLKLSGGLDVIFSPFINLYLLISGDAYVNVISEITSPGFYDLGQGGNVYSMIGYLIGYAGFIKGIIIALFYLGGVYLLLGLALRMRSSALWAGSLYYTAIFSFGWFDYYFWSIRPYEILVFSFIGVIVESYRKRTSNLHNARMTF